jgi:4-carboxymuconolactone decarboxylase
MARLPEITNPEQLPEDQRDLFDYLAGTRGSVRPPFSIVMHSPETARRISHLGTYLRFESSLPPKVNELAICATAREFDCRHEFFAHSRLAREAGALDETLAVIANRGPLEDLSDEDALPVRYARELLRDHEAQDETFAAVLERYGEAGAIELTATIGYYAMMACLLNALEIYTSESEGVLPKLG